MAQGSLCCYDERMVPTTYYFSLIRLKRGRTWYRVDSAQTADKELAHEQVGMLHDEWPAAGDYMVGNSREHLNYGPVPVKHAVWTH